MSILLGITTGFLLGTLIFFHSAEGKHRVITVTHSQWSETLSVNGTLALFYHMDGNCSFDNALANLIDNTVINITTNVELSWISTVIGFTNILLTGHNNPTVNCNHYGGLSIVSCYNCTIEGLTLDGCGASNISDNENDLPAIQLYNSSNVTIKNCSFQYSVGQAIVLSGMSREVSISDCNFLYNNQYKGHGAAIHYSSNITHAYPLKFVIDNCTFSYNEGAESIVYLGQSSTKLYEPLHLHNSSFYHNKGVPIYLSHQNLHITGSIEICSNIAENGSGILISDYSNVIFHKNTKILFRNNAANNGGAIYLTNRSSISTFKQISTSNDYEDNFQKILVTFYHNQASWKNGGAIYAVNSNMTFGGNTIVIFSENKAYLFGGAISAYHSTVTFEGNSTAEYNSNKAIYGGTIYIGDHSTITFV